MKNFAKFKLRESPQRCAECEVRKLALFGAIPDSYVSQAQEFRKSQIEVEARATVYDEDAPSSNAYTVFEGWVLLYRAHSDGTFQGLRVALPGDFIGFMPRSAGSYHHSAMSISNAVLCCFSQENLHRIIETHTELGARIYAMQSEYMANCQSTLLGLGRKSAEQRITHLLADLHYRMSIRKMLDGHTDSMPFPMTQEMVGQMTGLTAVHVNRVVRRLKQDKVCEFTREAIVNMDVAKLTEIGEFVRPTRYTS